MSGIGENEYYHPLIHAHGAVYKNATKQSEPALLRYE